MTHDADHETLLLPVAGGRLAAATAPAGGVPPAPHHQENQPEFRA
jgi:hypothetical protein